MQTTLPVLLTLSGRSQSVPGEEDAPIQLMTTGQLTVSGGTYTLRYQESQPEDDAGRLSTQNITLQMQTGRVVMTREGISAHQWSLSRGVGLRGPTIPPMAIWIWRCMPPASAAA